MVVELLDGSSGTDTWLSIQLVDAGIAQKCDQPTKRSENKNNATLSQYLPG